MKWQIVYLRHIKILPCHMVSIYSKHHMTWLWKQCVHIHNQNMHYHIGNLFCGVVHNFHVFIFKVQNLISTIPMSVL